VLFVYAPWRALRERPGLALLFFCAVGHQIAGDYVDTLNITGLDVRDRAIAWAQKVSGLVKTRDSAESEAIEKAIQQFRSANFQIAVFGKAKRGKSTLINALLGRHDDLVAPIDKLPASSAITRFTWSRDEAARVTFRGSRTEAIPYARIREFVTEEFNQENAKEVEVVDVTGPFPGLDQDLTLIDTPGAGSIHEHHDALLHAFIPQADAVIFLVTARMPIDQDELELLAKVKAADIRKVFFAVNRVDELDDADIEVAIGHNQQLLRQAAVPAEKIYRISAKLAYQGDTPHSGLASLLDDMREYLAANKVRVLRERFTSRVGLIAGHALSALDVERSSGRKSSDELNAELRTLQEKKRSLQSERSLTEREFNLSWNSAVDELERGLQTAKHELLAEVGNLAGKSRLTEVSKLSRQLPTVINDTVEQKLAPYTRAFEETARTAATKLEAAYPSVLIGEAGTVAIRTKLGNELIVGSAGGVAAAATGVGLAAAGSAVAASIAAANAAALAATATVAAPSVISGVLGWLGLQALAPLATGTATVAAPAALTATPLWVALAGPVGWTLAGIGVLAIPFSWRLSKIKLRDKLEEAAKEQVSTVLSRLKNERIPALRGMGKSMVEEFRIRLDRELDKIESILTTARDRRPDAQLLAQTENLASDLRHLLHATPEQVP
jgi:GTPase SAR1 family protein